MDAEDLINQLVLEIGDRVIPGSGAPIAANFSAMVVHVLADAKLSDEELSEFKSHAKSFIEKFGELIRLEDNNAREAALGSILWAQYISAWFAGGPRVWLRIKNDIEKERTKKANDARRRPDLREIIKQKAQIVINSDPNLENQPYKTAEIICNDVIVAVNNLPKVPKGWKLIKSDRPTDGEIKKAVDRIRHHLPQRKRSEK